MENKKMMEVLEIFKAEANNKDESELLLEVAEQAKKMLEEKYKHKDHTVKSLVNALEHTNSALKMAFSEDIWEEVPGLLSEQLFYIENLSELLGIEIGID